MKINRFNESSSMLKEPWNAEKIEKIRVFKKEIRKLDGEFEEILQEYLLLNPQIGEEPNIIDNDTSVVDYDFRENKYCKLVINYYAEPDDEDVSEACITHKQYEDFLDFLKDKDLYKNAKKYNL